MDAFAAASHAKAAAAIEQGRFADEIIPVEIEKTTLVGKKIQREKELVTVDDGVRPGTTPETLAKLRFQYHAWFHITRHGGYQGLHNHQNASWSGIFCVDPGDELPERPDSGRVRFHDPRAGAQMYADAGNAQLRLPYQHGGFDVTHRAGRLVMFPSHLFHEIFPYQGERPRIVIAFNCAVS
jgi:hypothetical protein